MTTLPLPSFYDPKAAERWSYSPDQQAIFTAAAAYRKGYGVRPSAKDSSNVHLLLIDVQKDFCFPQGSLYVAGRVRR